MHRTLNLNTRSQRRPEWPLLKLRMRFGVMKGILDLTFAMKRALDIIGSAVLILLLSPLFLLTAVAVVVEDGFPILYNPVRISKWGRPFKMFKFRSMLKNAEALKAELDSDSMTGKVLFKMKNDPRITRVGRIIRKLSIDELPQLFNVLKGDMSLVGPRPPLPDEVAMYSAEERKRLDVTPGITCIWQVSGRSDIDFEGQVKLDLLYIREPSIKQDILLLLRTVPAVLLGKGAY